MATERAKKQQTDCRSARPRRISSRYCLSDRQGSDPRTSIRATVAFRIRYASEHSHSNAETDGSIVRGARWRQGSLPNAAPAGAHWGGPLGRSPSLPLAPSLKWKRFQLVSNHKAIIRLVNSLIANSGLARSSILCGSSEADFSGLVIEVTGSRTEFEQVIFQSGCHFQRPTNQ